VTPLTIVAPYGRAGASARVRVYEWLDHTGEPAVVHDYAGAGNNQPATLLRDPARVWRAERELKRLAHDAPHRLLMHREATPFGRGALEQRILGNAAFSVFDFDDALQCDTRGGLLRRGMTDKRAKVHRCVRQADRVVAGNDVLAEWAAEHSQDVRVIPSCVAPQSYRVKHDHTLGWPPVLGWMGSPTTERYLLGLTDVLLDVHRETGARVKVVSAGHGDLGRLTPIADRVAWSAEHFGTQLLDVDVALAPLPDTDVARGKCAYKLLQYAATGLPQIGSPVGANRVVLDDVGGVCATTRDEWRNGLFDLLRASEPVRHQLGRAARAAVDARWSYDVWSDAWLRAMTP
jgi:glycosyltransferase involved in cell wall biosynthesis